MHSFLSIIRTVGAEKENMDLQNDRALEMSVKFTSCLIKSTWLYSCSMHASYQLGLGFVTLLHNTVLGDTHATSSNQKMLIVYMSRFAHNCNQQEKVFAENLPPHRSLCKVLLSVHDNL